MKLDSLAAPEVTSVEIVHETTKAPLGVVLHAHTPDSAEYARLEKKYSNPAKKTVVNIGKKGSDNSIEIDPEDAIAREKVLVASVYQIDGIDDLEDSPAARRKVLTDRRFGYMLRQLAEHVSDSGNYWTPVQDD